LEYFNWDNRDIITGFLKKEDKKSMTVIIRQRMPPKKKVKNGNAANVSKPNQQYIQQ
jgi:hypothetical protein